MELLKLFNFSNMIGLLAFALLFEASKTIRAGRGFLLWLEEGSVRIEGVRTDGSVKSVYFSRVEER